MRKKMIIIIAVLLVIVGFIFILYDRPEPPRYTANAKGTMSALLSALEECHTLKGTVLDGNGKPCSYETPTTPKPGGLLCTATTSWKWLSLPKGFSYIRCAAKPSPIKFADTYMISASNGSCAIMCNETQGCTFSNC